MFNKLKDYILLKLGITELRHNLATAEKNLNDRFDFLGAYMNLTQKEDIEIDPAIASKVATKLCAEYNIDTINMATHKNDVMFAIHVFGHRYNLENAVYTNFRIGAETALNLKRICEEYKIAPQKILDFGSGYGRVSRFLKQKFPESEIEISEVKSQALDFQKRHFGFKGIFHSQDAESLNCEKQDLILAVSVFSHLPKTTFAPWLNKLIQCLNSGGALVFTFNNSEDPKYFGVTKNQNFVYQQVSEDSKFAFLSDSIKDTNDYGHTFVTHQYLEDLLSKNDVSYHFLGKSLVQSQESIIIIKN
ncbi:class I SAM-dependent methyltransferase [Owenweeksia hongkongensis]|uniref:class I SAM-dependent methyltransferase n=1 Tax=Owenweeksia hongkongensis TaxID=253245 RepID=UPI003A8F8A8A